MNKCYSEAPNQVPFEYCQFLCLHTTSVGMSSIMTSIALISNIIDSAGEIAKNKQNNFSICESKKKSIALFIFLSAAYFSLRYNLKSVHDDRFALVNRSRFFKIKRQLKQFILGCFKTSISETDMISFHRSR